MVPKKGRSFCEIFQTKYWIIGRHGYTLVESWIHHGRIRV